jgi:hypothetical protein
VLPAKTQPPIIQRYNIFRTIASVFRFFLSFFRLAEKKDKNPVRDYLSAEKNRKEKKHAAGMQPFCLEVLLSGQRVSCYVFFPHVSRPAVMKILSSGQNPGSDNKKTGRA